MAVVHFVLFKSQSPVYTVVYFVSFVTLNLCVL